MPYDVTNPNPRALVESLRSVGYSVATAVADIIDNSVTAGAANIWIDFRWNGSLSDLKILDDGKGMSEAVLVEAMRPGTSSPTELRAGNDLGRFGLGLKTASFSQCRQLTVWSKTKAGSLAGRRWDLDYVVKHNEWRLQKDLPPPGEGMPSPLTDLGHGTLVTWNKLDRLVDGHDVNDSEAHQKFLGHVKDVQRYLEMIFHRHIAGQAATHRSGLTIFVNGGQLVPWDPFNVGSSAPVEASPIEEISYNGKIVRVRGYVLTHKDKLNSAEFERGGGPRGWIAQQGFYIYRNDRMLLAGDWLRLGRGSRPWAKEEQYKLARLSIDIGNSMDLEWSLDVKKSTARPPSALRPRLTGLAESQRKRAKEVFVFRGVYGTRPVQGGLNIERPWESHSRGIHTAYRINRQQPLIRGVLERLGPLQTEVESMLRLIEETVPVQKIWIDVAESEVDHAIPYEGIPDADVMVDLKKTYDFLRQAKLNHPNAIAYLLASEPFNRYPKLVEQLRP